MKTKTSDLVFMIKPDYALSPALWGKWIERKFIEEKEMEGYIRYRDFILPEDKDERVE